MPRPNKNGRTYSFGEGPDILQHFADDLLGRMGGATVTYVACPHHGRTHMVEIVHEPSKTRVFVCQAQGCTGKLVTPADSPSCIYV